jgi:hypothetical protein
VKVAVALIVLVFAGYASAAVSKPTLRVASQNPLTIRGDRFADGERVVLTVMTGYGARRATVVARGGRFRVALGSAKGCGAAYAVRAVGNQGSKATLVFGEAPFCVPPPRD